MALHIRFIAIVTKALFAPLGHLSWCEVLELAAR